MNLRIGILLVFKWADPRNPSLVEPTSLHVHTIKILGGVVISAMLCVVYVVLSREFPQYKLTPMATTIEVHGAADFHVHLRQGTLSSLVTPHVRSGGFGLAYVMVNHCARHRSEDIF